LRCSYSAFAHAHLAVQHRELRKYGVILEAVLLAEVLDAFVDFNVLLATDVRGLELIVTHVLRFN